MDSIVKNHSDPYKRLFAGNVVSTFGHVFKHSNEKGRASLFKLRNTWNDVFTPTVLTDLDKVVNKMDPAWPIMKPKAPASQPTNIHINPAVFGRTSNVSIFRFLITNLKYFAIRQVGGSSLKTLRVLRLFI
jgi:pre-mRNA cleavage complex 2 protein Pcf11